ncbi:UNVERIFIED_CONTAM: putative disease resistance RPP13-like protein 3 [Sesamum angustifolium]|uniref:Disease resistance RPP13-like protein 3 n=1 Tax=Sesamum angustifolium TaxID=2727405 RepID=A0AAW2QAF5_9LAMI
MAYAAVISLRKTIEGLPYSPLISSLPPFPTASAYKEVKLLEQFLQRPVFTSGSSERVNALEWQIREIVCRLQDVLESYVLKQFLSQSETIHRGRTSYPLILSRDLALEVKEEIDFFVQKVQVIVRAELSNLSLTEDDDTVVSSRTAEVFLDRKKSKIIGFDNELINLKILLTRDTRDLEVVSIFGMAGIGKTALANEVYIDPLVQQYFDCSAFVPIGQKYEVRKILLGILAQTDCGIDGTHAESSEELSKYLCRSLEDMRYLIVLDDIWNGKLWFELKRFFPNNRKGSRIVLTTRLEMVAFYATNSRKYLHRMRFLNENESWHLLRETVFGKEHSCPPQLEKAGKKIAEKCEGLPLAIIEVGKQLSKAERTPEYWNEVALAEKKIQFSIVQTRKFQSRAPGAKLKPVESILSLGTCVLNKLGKKFFHVVDHYANQGIESQLRLCIHNNGLFGIKDVYQSMTSSSDACSLLCVGPHHPYPVPMCLSFGVLKILDALTIRFYGFPIEVVKLVQLKYLAFTYNGKLPASISKLKSLQYLIVRQYLTILPFGGRRLYLPTEIWTMQELKHLQVMGSDLPNPSLEDACLPNLSTLLGISAHSCTKEVLGRIPNLTRLGIQIGLTLDVAEPLCCFDHLRYLRRLESLKCIILNPNPGLRVVVPTPPITVFPSSLKKLTLSGLGFPWEYMSTIAKLRNLEVLKLRCHAFRGPVWNAYDCQFLQLKFLLLEDIDLESWYRGLFPWLERLIIRDCYKLKRIPLGIKKISSLEMIELVDCNPSLVSSAMRIAEEQKSTGDDYLQICIKSSADVRT